MKQLVLIALASVVLSAAEVPGNICERPSAGSTVPEPEDLRSSNGVLKVDLTIHNSLEPDGSARYCYIDGNGKNRPIFD